jgi:glutamate synthase domain-containing protein 2
MSLSKINATAATETRNRTPGDVSPMSGLCATCIEGCPGLCEIGKSAFRAAEIIYPQPFGAITAAAQKTYPIDYSHLNIMGTAVGAHGIEPDPDRATFTNVRVDVRLGHDKGIHLLFPVMIPGLGSTDVARRNWEGLAIGAAISGIGLTIGENVVGMDDGAIIEKGRVVHSPDLEKRVRLYADWQHDGAGIIALQTNVEDSRLGVLEYGLEKLGIKAVELKWGQGAKTIGGEVKIANLEKARLLKNRGYIVLPDPFDPLVEDAFGRGAFKEFERHSRVGMVNEEEFVKRVKDLRKRGAKYVFLKTGAYRPADLARAVKFSSIAGIDILTVDAAGGGTGMSPWRMMNEWGVPPLEMATLTYRYIDKLAKRGAHVPHVVMAGGFSLEDHIFKALALGAPYVRAVGMARAPLTAVMVGKTIGRAVAEENIPRSVEKYGRTLDEIFVLAANLKKRFGENFKKIPAGAIGLYTYLERLSQGLRQFMCGERKFALEYLTRDDLVALTREASELTGIKYVMEADKEEAERILG